MTRVEDSRILPRLERHLLTDGDPEVRARIARGLGVHERVEAAGALVQALETETEAAVLQEVLGALNRLDEPEEEPREGAPTPWP